MLRGGTYTAVGGFSPDLFTYEKEVILLDEPGANVTMTRADVDHDLSPVVTITSGYPYSPEEVKGEYSLHWTVAPADDLANIVVDQTDTFALTVESASLATEAVLLLTVSDLQPGEYLYTLSSEYAPANRTFKAYVDDILKPVITLNKSMYKVGEDSEALMDVEMTYGYPYVSVDPSTAKPTVNITTDLIGKKETMEFSDEAWQNAEMNYTAKIALPLDAVTNEIVKENEGNLPLSITIAFNDKTQFYGNIEIPFEYVAAGLNNISDAANDASIKYYNPLGEEVAESYRGLMISSKGEKIIRK